VKAIAGGASAVMIGSLFAVVMKALRIHYL
jgi:NAD(P)H-dependent flavin oxidoreductase YrpB (nitropropane dioxygenase family)